MIVAIGGMRSCVDRQPLAAPIDCAKNKFQFLTFRAVPAAAYTNRGFAISSPALPASCFGETEPQAGYGFVWRRTISPFDFGRRIPARVPVTCFEITSL